MKYVTTSISAHVALALALLSTTTAHADQIIEDQTDVEYGADARV